MSLKTYIGYDEYDGYAATEFDDCIPYLNLEDYLKSLPDIAKIIDISNRNLTIFPDLSRFTNLTNLDCSNNKLTNLPPLNANLIQLTCSDNQLECLPQLPEKLDILHCCNNLLTYLPPLNTNLRELVCCENQIQSLPPLPEKLNTLWCYRNKLTQLPSLNPYLLKLWCSENQLTSLPIFNLKLKVLVCDTNKLTSIPNLSPVLTNVVCFNNPIFKMISDPNFNIMRCNIQKLNRFKELFYCLKYKSQFRYLLWIKLREPKIQQYYHPENLLQLLDNNKNILDDNNLYNLLTEW